MTAKPSIIPPRPFNNSIHLSLAPIVSSLVSLSFPQSAVSSHRSAVNWIKASECDRLRPRTSLLTYRGRLWQTLRCKPVNTARKIGLLRPLLSLSPGGRTPRLKYSLCAGGNHIISGFQAYYALSCITFREKATHGAKLRILRGTMSYEDSPNHFHIGPFHCLICVMS